MNRLIQKFSSFFLLGSFLSLGCAEFSSATTTTPSNSVEDCLTSMVLTADIKLTIEQLQVFCSNLVNNSSNKNEISAESTQSNTVEDHPIDQSLLQSRLQMEALNRSNRFILTPHKRNFFMPAVYHDEPNTAPFIEANSPLSELDNTEAEIQLSIKILMRENIFGNNGHLYFAYTNHSFWQLYSKEDSAPFRGTDHEPEAFLSFTNDREFWGIKNTVNEIGINHQSNGQGGLLSRSWNRIILRSVFEIDKFVLGVSPYYRLKESDKKDPLDKDGDDNPDIVDYMGHYELIGSYKFDNSILAVTTRNIFEQTNHATYDVSYTFPISKNIRGMVRYFNGYGYSLIDYNAKQEAIGIGILFTDWY